MSAQRASLTCDTEPSRVRLPAAARGRPFHLLWFGEGVSVLGNATTSVLLPLLAIRHLHAGAGWMGAITAAAWVPWLLIGLPAGAWVDRLAPRAIMIAADLVAAAALVSVPVAWWLGELRLGQLVAVAFAGGVATVFFRTAYIKLIPQVVPDAALESANARLLGTESAMEIVGPGLGGAVVAVVSAATGLLIDVVSFLVSALCLWRIGARPANRPPPPLPDGPAAPVTQRIREGLRIVLHDRNLRSLMFLGSATNFGLTGYNTLLVLFLAHQLGLGSSAIGVVLMIGSSGGLFGAAVATRLARRIGTGRASTALLLISGPCSLLIGLPTHADCVFVTVLGLMLVGAAVVGGNVVRGAWRQRYVPAQLMGRVVATSQMANFGTMPLAGVVAGLLGAHVGIRPTIFIMASVNALACCGFLLTRLGRARELPRRLAIPA